MFSTDCHVPNGPNFNPFNPADSRNAPYGLAIMDMTTSTYSAVIHASMIRRPIMILLMVLLAGASKTLESQKLLTARLITGAPTM